MRRPTPMPDGQANLYRRRLNGIEPPTELQKTKKIFIPGETPNPTRKKAISISTAGTRLASAHFPRDRAPSELSTCSAMDGSGPPPYSSPSPDSKHFPFTADTRPTSLMASTTSSKEVPRAQLHLCCVAHFATGSNRTTNTFTQDSAA